MAIHSFYRAVREPETWPLPGGGSYTIPRLGYGPAYLTPEECGTPYVEVLFFLMLKSNRGYGAIVPQAEACPIVTSGLVEDGYMISLDAKGQKRRYHLLDGLGETIDSFDYTPERLRSLLQATGTTREQAAKMLGVSKRAVDAWCLPEDSQTHRDMPIKKWRFLQANCLDQP